MKFDPNPTIQKFKPYLTLNENLKLLGYRTLPAGFGKKLIIKEQETIGAFTAHQTTEYLKEKHGVI